MTLTIHRERSRTPAETGGRGPDAGSPANVRITSCDGTLRATWGRKGGRIYSETGAQVHTVQAARGAFSRWNHLVHDVLGVDVVPPMNARAFCPGGELLPKRTGVYGINCSECGRSYLLRKDGTVRRHRVSDAS